MKIYSYFDLTLISGISSRQLVTSLSPSASELDNLAKQLADFNNQPSGISLLENFEIQTKLTPLLKQSILAIQAAERFTAFLKSFFDYIEVHLYVSQEKHSELNKSAKELFCWLKIQVAKLTKVIRQLKYSASLVRIELNNLIVGSQLEAQTQTLINQITELIALASRVIQHIDVNCEQNQKKSHNPTTPDIENPQGMLKHEIFTQPADEALAQACFDAVLQIDELVNKNPAN